MLMDLVEIARELLDVIVQGPEGDAIWEAYQGDDEETQEETSLMEGLADDDDPVSKDDFGDEDIIIIDD